MHRFNSLASISFCKDYNDLLAQQAPIDGAVLALATVRQPVCSSRTGKQIKWVESFLFSLSSSFLIAGRKPFHLLLINGRRLYASQLLFVLWWIDNFDNIKATWSQVKGVKKTTTGRQSEWWRGYWFVFCIPHTQLLTTYAVHVSPSVFGPPHQRTKRLGSAFFTLSLWYAFRLESPFHSWYKNLFLNRTDALRRVVRNSAISLDAVLTGQRAKVGGKPFIYLLNWE